MKYLIFICIDWSNTRIIILSLGKADIQIC